VTLGGHHYLIIAFVAGLLAARIIYAVIRGRRTKNK